MPIGTFCRVSFEIDRGAENVPVYYVSSANLKFRA